MQQVTRADASAEGDPASTHGGQPKRLSWLGNHLEDEKTLGYVLMLPAVLLIVVFIAYPFSVGVWMSLTDKLVGEVGNFIGFDNYRKLFRSEIFWTAAWNTVFFTTIATIFKTVLGMWLAVLLARKFRFQRITRSAVHAVTELRHAECKPFDAGSQIHSDRRDEQT